MADIAEGLDGDQGSNPRSDRERDVTRRSFIKRSVAVGVVGGLAGDAIFAQLASAGIRRPHVGGDRVVQPMLDALQDGQTLDLKGEVFTLTNTVHLRGRKNVTIDNGTFLLTPGTTKADRNTCIMAMDLCQGVVLGPDLVLDGGHPQASYDAVVEGQHALFVAGSSGCEIYGTFGGVKGDAIYLRHSIDRSRRVWNSDSMLIAGTMSNVGRHGITVTQDVTNLRVDGATIVDTAHGAIDVEPQGSLQVPGMVITNSEIHGPIAMQGQFGSLKIVGNRFGVISGKLRGREGASALDGVLEFTDNVALTPKGDGSSQGLTVEGWAEANVCRNTQPYATTKRNYQIFVHARNVHMLHVDDNLLPGLHNHGFILREGRGLRHVTARRNKTTRDTPPPPPSRLADSPGSQG